MTNESVKRTAQDHQWRVVLCDLFTKNIGKSLKATLVLLEVAQEVHLAVEEKRLLGSPLHERIGKAKVEWQRCHCNLIQLRFRVDKEVARVSSDMPTPPLPSLKAAVENALVDLEQAKLELDTRLIQWGDQYPVEL